MTIVSVVATVGLYVFLWGCFSGVVASFFEVSDSYPFPDWSKGFPRKFKATCIAISPFGILFFLCCSIFFVVRWLYRELTGYGE